MSPKTKLPRVHASAEKNKNSIIRSMVGKSYNDSLVLYIKYVSSIELTLFYTFGIKIYASIILWWVEITMNYT